jgi:hypothetical protein
LEGSAEETSLDTLESPRYVGRGVAKIVFGALFILIAISIQWFNEERSAKMTALLVRGFSEVQNVDADIVVNENRGRIVHIQGKTRAADTIVDDQFSDAQVNGCLKLQSTVEVFEWVQTIKTVVDVKKEKMSQPRFHTEWSTFHNDSMRFKKPSPENPRLPVGLITGTSTKTCKRVELGAFVFTDEMLSRFQRFEPAIKHLPPTLTSRDGLTFFANQGDGYYYARPGASTSATGGKGMPPNLFTEPQVGDVRIRFLCVPEGDATVVAVQCEKEPGVESFVPYRSITRPPCLTEIQERIRLIEEGDRPLKDTKRKATCCSSGVGACCCCPCNFIAFCAKEEVVTEEIFYISDRQDPMEKAFQTVVHRSPVRVWMFRLLGWGILYGGARLVLQAFAGLLRGAHGLTVYGSSAPSVLALIVTLGISACTMAAAHVCYRPFVALKWLCGLGLIFALLLGFGARG